MTDILLARSGHWRKYPAVDVLFSSGRENLVLGVDKPTDVTAGRSDRTAPLTVVTAASQLPGGAITPGATYVGYDFRFVFVVPTGTAEIVIRESKFSGHSTALTSTTGLVRAYNPGHCPLTVYDTDFEPTRPDPYWVGVQGTQYVRILRSRFRMLVDGIESFPPLATPDASNTRPDAVPAGCYQSLFYDFTWWPPGTPGTSSDGSHNDSLQMQGGKNYEFRGNACFGYMHTDYFDTTRNTNRTHSVLQMTPDVGAADGLGNHITGFQFTDNWCEGGGSASLIFSHEPAPTSRWLSRVSAGETSVGDILRNKFVADTSWTGLEILSPSNTPIVINKGTGADINVIDGTSTEVVWSPGGGP